MFRTAGTADPDRSLPAARGAGSRRVRLDEAEAQLRVARSPYTTNEQRLERYLWAAFLAARYADENPASFKVCRILQRSAQGFLAAWQASARSEQRLFFVGGERFEVSRPAIEDDEPPRALRWRFVAAPDAGRRTIVARLTRRRVPTPRRAAEPRTAAAPAVTPAVQRPGSIAIA